MDQALKTIANMEFSQAVERLTKEKDKKMRLALASLSGGGPQVAAKREIELEFAEEMCKAYADIWIELLERKNGGELTRQHVEFIKEQVVAIASARRGALTGGPPMAGNQQAIASHVAREMNKVVARVNQAVELRFLRQDEGLSKKNMSDGIHVTVQNAANINFGSQVGTINAALTVISQQGQTEIANAIGDLSNAIVQSAALKDIEKDELLQVMSELAKQAEVKEEARSKGTLRALISGLPFMIKTATDLTALWEKWGPIVRAYFGV